MKDSLRRPAQIIAIVIVHAITLLILAWAMEGIVITSFLSAIGAAIAFTVAQATFWYVFVQFLSWLPPLLYPVLNFVLIGFLVFWLANLIPGITIDSWVTGLRITIWMTIVNAIVSGFLSLDEESIFDRVVIHRMVKKVGKITHTETPGFVYLEIDGLGEAILRRAVQEGYMPTLKQWLDRGSHRITGWETDFTSQTGAMQTGILLGNNFDVPAYRWWDRGTKKIVMSGNPRDAIQLEAKLSTGRGLLSDGGASRGNMFSGDAEESLITMSTVLNKSRGRGPGFYFYLFSPYVLARLVTRFIVECLVEWKDAWQQKRRKDPFRVSARNPVYAFLRAFMGPLMQDLATYMVISDVLRGIPAVYALYAAYDDLSHFAGMLSPESFKSLHEMDRYFARIEKALESAPRPYHIVVLSDHGQTLGYTMKKQFGVSLEELVDALIKGEGEVYEAQKTHETWDKMGALLSDSIQENTRTAHFLGRMLKTKREGDVVEVGPQPEDIKARASKAVVVASGGAGLIYLPNSDVRLTQEQIQEANPELLVGLVQHPAIGFVLVRSSEFGDMVLSKGGIYYLEDGKVDGINPLAPYGPNAARHVKRESSFPNCPDILVNTVYDPETELMYCLENQVSHHGSLGGPQNFAFLVHPSGLSTGDEPIVTAECLHRVIRGWREQTQGIV